MLWFDVGKETYTTGARDCHSAGRLWFDVGKETYTTIYRKGLEV